MKYTTEKEKFNCKSDRGPVSVKTHTHTSKHTFYHMIYMEMTKKIDCKIYVHVQRL